MNDTGNKLSATTGDNAGDMTTDEQGNRYVYDAWGHVVQINSSSGTTLETLRYDALGRNVAWSSDAGCCKRDIHLLP